MLVTTREINNSFRAPQVFEANPKTHEIYYLQSKHWKVPPDEAVDLVAQHIDKSYPIYQITQIVLEKVLV